MDSWFGSDTLRRQLLRWVLIPMLILLLLNVVLAYKFGVGSANRNHDRFLYDVSWILRDQLRTNQEGQVEFNIHSGAMDMLSEDKKDQLYYSVSGWQQEYHFGNPDLPAPPDQLSETPSYYMANYAGQPVRMMAAIIPEYDVASGRVVVMVAKTLKLRDERIVESMWRVLPSQLILIIFAGIMIWYGVGLGLRPLLLLRDDVASRTLLDLRPLPEDKVVAEIRPLIHGFNQLMSRLEESMVMQRRFIADAAHQLRTPLSGLKAQTELALRSEDAAEIRHSLQQIHQATEHAAHMANQLLVLARSEPDAQHRDSMSELDLVELARNTTEYWAQRPMYKQIDLGFESDGCECRITGNSMLLGEMLSNLIDNALRYTQPGGQVTVRIGCDDATVCMEVEDNGPGIPESDHERVFERFYRVLGTNQDGCGLGLSIVREIAYSHNAEVRLLSGANGSGTLMQVIFRSTSSPVSF